MITISGIQNASTHLSGNPVEITATTSGIPPGATNYKILLKIVSTDGILIGSPFIPAITPFENVAVFNISGYIDQAIEKDFVWPIPNQWGSRWHGYEYQSYDLQIFPGEQYVDDNDNLVENYQEMWGTLFIVKGRLPNYFLSWLNSGNSNWNEYFRVGGRWLTLVPDFQKVTPYQPGKLWWQPPVNGEWTFGIKACYDDNSTAQYSSNVGMWVSVVFEFHLYLPYNEIPLIGEGGKKVQFFEVTLEGPVNLQKRTFVIDWNYHEQVYYLFVDNRFGGVDCIALTGAVRYSPTGERIVSSVPVRAGNTLKQRTKYTSGSYRERRWIINTGFKSPHELNALDVLLDTEYAWLAIPPLGGSDDITTYYLTPVRVANTELSLSNSAATEPESFDIELIEAS